MPETSMADCCAMYSNADEQSLGGQESYCCLSLAVSAALVSAGAQHGLMPQDDPLYTGHDPFAEAESDIPCVRGLLWVQVQLQEAGCPAGHAGSMRAAPAGPATQLNGC